MERYELLFNKDGSSNLDWMDEGKCHDMDPAKMFPSDGVGSEEAQRVCVGCAVADICLEYALVNRIEHGVWGGESERSRRRILRQRHKGSRSPGAID